MPILNLVLWPIVKHGLGQIAQFLNDLAIAWENADQADRNRLATKIFEKVWVRDGVIEGVTPRPELAPFFNVVYSEAVKDYLQWRLRREPHLTSREQQVILLLLREYKPLEIAGELGLSEPYTRRLVMGLRMKAARLWELQEMVDPYLAIRRCYERNKDKYNANRRAKRQANPEEYNARRRAKRRERLGQN